MKKIRLITALLLVAALLSGCNIVGNILENTEKEYTHGDVKAILPATFLDYSDTSIGENADFVFASANVGLLGVEDPKQALFDLYGSMDLQGYAELIAGLYEVAEEPREQDGFLTFTYDNTVDASVYTYVTVFYETPGSYWIIQAYSLKEDYEEYAADLWKYATSVQITDDGPEVTAAATTEPEATTLPAQEDETSEPAAETTAQLPTLHLPDDFLNYTDTTLAEGYTFMYANEGICILGICENKEELHSYFGDTDVEGYANLINQMYEIGGEPTLVDGVWTLAYTAEVEGVEYTYVCAFSETETDYWNIQGNCLSEDYEEYADDIWQYITDIEF